ncbi:MAG: hypothetical protein ACKO40_04550 [Planctomycetaceae bacterium]
MVLARTTVFLPCHTLDDFPTWLDETEADDLLAAWIAAWHPAVIAAVGGPPTWAAVDLPVADGPLLGIVPRSWDDRFEAQCGATDTSGSVFVRGVAGTDAISRAALAAVDAAVADPLPSDDLAPDFHALGLAALLAELLARRMRSSADLDDAFRAAAATAAREAVAGRVDAARAALRECFDGLAATRARYYPVDSWVLDLVLVGGAATAASVAASLASPGPVGVIAGGATIERLADERPEVVRVLREAIASGRVVGCGGRDVDGGLDLLAAEDIAASFDRGQRAWRDALGTVPRTYARLAGGLTHLVPPLLADRGYRGLIWPAFDGSPVPDIGGGVASWESAGGRIDAIASRPLDAGAARTVLSLHETLGDAMDHDHSVVLAFAHVAGRATRWHALLRRIGGWSNLLGTFATPEGVLDATAAVGRSVSFEPDAFPPSLVAESGGEVDAALASAARAAARIVDAAPSIPAGAAEPVVPVPAVAGSPPRRRSAFRLFGGRRDEPPAVDNGLVRVELNAATGGILALRRRAAAANRLSQQIALRTTAAAPAVGQAWVAEEDRQTVTRMLADETGVENDAAGRPQLVARGRLVTEAGVAARFVQRVSLVPGRPLAIIDVDVDVDRPHDGPLSASHVALRFAWNENDPVEIRRSVHTQAVVTDRTRFTAPHFVHLVPDDTRRNVEPVTVLTGGLPWHLLSSPHVLDSLAGPASGRIVRRVGVGFGLDRPWDAALALIHGGLEWPACHAAPATVRLTAAPGEAAASAPGVVRVGLLESAGVAGPTAVDWGRPVARATAIDAAGSPRADVSVAIDGTRTVVSLARYQWLEIEVGFAG